MDANEESPGNCAGCGTDAYRCFAGQSFELHPEPLISGRCCDSCDCRRATLDWSKLRLAEEAAVSATPAPVRRLDWVGDARAADGTTAAFAGGPGDAASEDFWVARMLERAAEADDGVERFGVGDLSAYQSLAASRALPLEEVLRAAHRNQLADIVRLPKTPQPTGEQQQ